MVRFYDSGNLADLARVETLLHQGGIEYFLAGSSASAGASMQIEVAEEDVPRAEELLLEIPSTG